MKCKNCGFELTAGQKFCPKCGTKAEFAKSGRVCPNTECGNMLAEELIFCDMCGTKYVADSEGGDISISSGGRETSGEALYQFQVVRMENEKGSEAGLFALTEKEIVFTPTFMKNEDEEGLVELSDSQKFRQTLKIKLRDIVKVFFNDDFIFIELPIVGTKKTYSFIFYIVEAQKGDAENITNEIIRYRETIIGGNVNGVDDDDDSCEDDEPIGISVYIRKMEYVYMDNQRNNVYGMFVVTENEIVFTPTHLEVMKRPLRIKIQDITKASATEDSVFIYCPELGMKDDKRHFFNLGNGWSMRREAKKVISIIRNQKGFKGFIY